MRKLLFFVSLILPALARAQSPAGSSSTPPPPAAELSLTDALILGTVEGVTEYLPVSSTGHLIIATHALGLESDAPLRDRRGEPLWYVKPSAKHPQGEPLTLKLAADTYTIVIQFGAIAAVVLLYRRQISSMIRGVFGRDAAGFRLLRNVLLAFIPAAVVGLALHHWIDAHFFSVPVVIAAQVVGALVILWAERYRRLRMSSLAREHRENRFNAAHTPTHPAAPAADYAGDLVTDPGAELTPRQAVNIGLLQCFALWPGMSRSMTTIVGGYLAGLDPRRSAEFSFLLGFATLSAATVFKSYKSGAAMIQVFGWPHVLFGCVVAAVTAAVAVKFLVGWLSRHGMAAFAYYRLAFAALLVALLGLGGL